MKALRDMTEPELGSLMSHVSAAVDEWLPPGTLFCVLVFDQPGACQYAANARRADVVAALRETAGRLERKEDLSRVGWTDTPPQG